MQFCWLCLPLLFLPSQHTEWIQSICGTHSKNIASPCQANQPQQPKELFRLGSPLIYAPKDCHDIAIAANNKWLAAAGRQKVYLWDIRKRAIIQEMSFPHQVYFVNFSPDCKYLATQAAGDQFVRLWDIEKKKVIANTGRHSYAITSMAFSPDGRLLATTTNGGGMYVWAYQSGEFKLKYRVGAKLRELFAVSFSPDGQIIAALSKRFRIQLWESKTGKELGSLKQDVPSAPLILTANRQLLSISSDGKTLACPFLFGRRLAIWNLALPLANEPLKINRLEHEIQSVLFSHSSKFLILHSRQKVSIYNPFTSAWVRDFQKSGNVESVAIARDGELLAGVGKDSLIHLWNVKNGKSQTDKSGHSAAVSCISYSPNGKHLVSAGLDGQICVWEPKNGKLLRRITNQYQKIYAMQFSPKGDYLAACGVGRHVTVWNTQDWKVEQRLVSSSHTVLSLQFSNHAKSLAAGSSDGLVHVWDLSVASESTVMIKHLYPNKLLFSRDGKRLFIGSHGEVVHIWDLERKKEVHRLNAFPNPKPLSHITGMSLSSDPNILLIGCDGRSEIAFWNLSTRKLQKTLSTDLATIGQLETSHDKTLLAAAGKKVNAVRFWNTNKWTAQLQLRTSPHGVSSIAFSNDDRQFAVGLNNGQIIVSSLRD